MDVRSTNPDGRWAALGVLLAIAAALAALAVLTGCGGSPAPAPSDPYVGRWAGTVVDDQAGTGRIELMLSDSANLAGSWVARAPGPEGAGTVSLLPAVPGDIRRHFGLRCGPAPAGSVLLSTSLSGDEIVGTYLAAGCGTLTQGSVRLGRQR